MSRLAGGAGGAVAEQPEQRGFWLVADAELVVFGATEPGAALTLCGEPVRLRDDGTFSVRMAFPDGKITMPVGAAAADGEQERGLTLRFERATQVKS